jgi:hypothetical protein
MCFPETHTFQEKVDKNIVVNSKMLKNLSKKYFRCYRFAKFLHIVNLLKIPQRGLNLISGGLLLIFFFFGGCLLAHLA